MVGMGPLYALGMAVIAAAHLAWQTSRIDLSRPELTYQLFFGEHSYRCPACCSVYSWDVVTAMGRLPLGQDGAILFLY